MGIDRGPLRLPKNVLTYATLLRIVSSAIIISSACSALLLVIWNLDRGLDLTDESTLLYFYRHPDAFLDRIYQHHFRLVRALVPSSLDHVYYYRLFKLLLLVGFTGAFTAVLSRWTRRLNLHPEYSLDPITLLFFLLTGSLLSYCHGSQTLSYNDLVTVSLLAVATAGFLLDLSPSRMNPDLWRFLISVLVGGILVMTFFVKWPSAVMLAIYYWLFSGLVSSGRWPRALLASFGGTICGAVVASFMTTDAGVGKVFSFTQLYEALSNPLNLGPHHDMSGLLAMYVENFVSRCVALLRSPMTLAALALPIGAMVASAYLHNGRTRLIVLGGFLLVGVVALLAFASDLPHSGMRYLQWFHRYHVAELQVFALAVAWIGVWACLPVLTNILRRSDLVILIMAVALVATLPAVGSIGTNNALLTQFIRHMAPLFAALAIVTALLGVAARWQPFAPVMCAAIAGLTAAQLAFVVLLHPYRLAKPGTDQTIELTDPSHLAGLKVDAPTHTFIRNLLGEARRAVGDTAGIPMLAMFDIPGVLYILDGIAIGFPWFPVGWDQVTCYRIESDESSRGEPRLIVLDRDELPAPIVECLKGAGIDLTSYVEFSRVPIPYGETAKRSLRLLVPRR